MWVAFAGLGIVLMYFANITRIATIFSMAIWISEWGFRPATRSWFVYSFHGHLGWMLYLATAGVYFQALTSLSAKWVRTTETPLVREKVKEEPSI